MKSVVLLIAIYLNLTFPNAVLALEDYLWNPGIELRGDDYTNNYFGGSFAERADGKFLVTYRFGNKAILSVVESEMDLLTRANASAVNEWEFYTFYSSAKDSETRLQIKQRPNSFICFRVWC